MSSVILVGMPGVGKSTVGRELAQVLDLPFRDLDLLFEERHGRTPAEVIRADGEEAFRRAETNLIAEVVTGPPSVIATGGGAVESPVARWHLWHAGPVVWLDAPDHVLHNRLSTDSTARPLTATAEQLAARRDKRLPFYRAADIHVDSSTQSERLARHLADRLTDLTRATQDATPGRMLFYSKVRRDHPMGPREAVISFADRFPQSFLTRTIAERSTGSPVIVVDQNVILAQPTFTAQLAGDRRFALEAGEQRKRLQVAEELLEFAASARAERADAWIAAGGGTTGDLVGTAAALYMRGAPLIQMPTTWLAMSDAAIGGKVAVDLEAAKNSAGAFWPPVAVLADVATLSTLSRDLLLDGMGETLKSGLIGDPWLWDLVRDRGSAALDVEAPDWAARYAMVERSAVLKLGVVERDPFEDGERRHLNLGHTIGHALEIESGYTLSHGRAVVLGLRAVAHMARARGGRADLAEEIDDVVGSLGFDLTRRFDAARVKEALAGDKKSHRGRIRWVLPMDVGVMEQANDITEDELDAALAHITE
ncbi:MAG: bifunctional shikimate kinase/3-dehydroquinate synthase [Bowdeniella nasicola]|nr:bifunctional shikimate kinase/3-dehydroquinate synthase [Bowdeniella nasicola]